MKSFYMPRNVAHVTLTYPNKYGISIRREINGKGYEVALLAHGRVTSHAAITNDVLRHQTNDQIAELLTRVAALPYAPYKIYY